MIQSFTSKIRIENPPFENKGRMKIDNLIQIYLDKVVPYKRERWVAFALLFSMFFLRIVFIRAFYLITYCLSIYLLHGFISFCTPREEGIPDPFENFDNDVYIPQTIDDEFRPFIRRLPEFDFWLFATKLVLLSFFATFFSIFNIPVFAPILFFYFVIVACLTAKNLYKHMRKYKYNPFFASKNSYKVSDK
jgi:hypothetical protein